MKHLKLFEQFSLILESIYDDVSVQITNKERGVSQPGAKSFDISLPSSTQDNNLHY